MVELNIRWLRNAFVVVALSLIAGLGYQQWRAYTNLEQAFTVDFRIVELHGVIVFLDEVLTMSARMAVTSGDLVWEQRYQGSVMELDAAIAELRNAAPLEISEFAEQTDNANENLVAMESQAFDLLRAGQQEQATMLLFSDAYEAQKTQYAAGMQTLSNSLSARREASLNSQIEVVLASFAELLLASLALAFLWFTYSGALKRQLTRKLEQSNSHNQMLFEHHPSGIIISQDEKIVLVNPAATRLLGADSEAGLLGKPTLEFVHPDYHETARQRIIRANQGLTNELTLLQVVALNGSVHDVETISIPCIYNGSEATEIALRDMTEQVQAERSLKVSEEHYRQLFENMRDIYFENSIDGTILNISPSVERLGYKRDELLGTDAALLYPDAKYRAQMVSHLKEQGVVDDFEMRLFNADGTTSDFSVSAQMKLDAHSDLPIIVGALRDISERVKAENSLRASEARLLVAQELAGLLWWEIDIDAGTWTLPDVFQRAMDKVADDSLEGMPRFLAIMYEGDGERLQALLRRVNRGGDSEEDTLRVLINGEVRWFQTRARLTIDEASNTRKIFGTSRDVTKERLAEIDGQKLREQYHASQKWESIGTLAGGIAHDVNNVLTGILGQVDLVRAHVANEPELQRRLQHIIDYSIRASRLANQMLALSGRGTLVVEEIHLDTALNSMSDALCAAISGGISLIFNHQPELRAVEADQAQLQQLMVNLLSNAAESLSATQNKIVVNTSNIIADESMLSSAINADDLQPGDYVALEVIDQGSGMSAELLAKAFDPFITTRHKGRGLGLSAALGIVKAHKGALIAKSTPGEGTCITVLLPAAPIRQPKQVPSSTPLTASTRNTVLVVDDEAMVREIAETVLVSQGFDVVQAIDGLEGVEQFQLHHDDLAAVILDLTMPRMDGVEAYREFQKIDSSIPVIICSGYAEGDLKKNNFGDGAVINFLPKPYRIEQLIGMLNSVAGLHSKT